MYKRSRRAKTSRPTTWPRSRSSEVRSRLSRKKRCPSRLSPRSFKERTLLMANRCCRSESSGEPCQVFFFFLPGYEYAPGAEDPASLLQHATHQGGGFMREIPGPGRQHGDFAAPPLLVDPYVT